MFYRKVYSKLIERKEKYADHYALLIEGARRVGKTTLAIEFAKKEYKSYIYINFTELDNDLEDILKDLANRDMFFARLAIHFGVELFLHETLIIFDEVQAYPKARQAIKFLVADGRYHFLETGSLISINQNVKNIVIPSEEMKIELLPLDYEEFLIANNYNAISSLKDFIKKKIPLGEASNRKLQRDFRVYMAVGGMPQAVDAYLKTKDFASVDKIKREIIDLYKTDFRKIDASGRISKIFDYIPSFLTSSSRRFILSKALDKERLFDKDKEMLFDLLDSKTVLASYNVSDPSLSLKNTASLYSYKLYLFDTGLFVTLLFNDETRDYKDIYAKLLANRLDVNLGYLYENVVAQILNSLNKSLYYHTFKEKGSKNYYEIDFLTAYKGKLVPIEVKGGDPKNHKSLDLFIKKYHSRIYESLIVTIKDLKVENEISFVPYYLLPFYFD